jgi:hypothetical protein
MRKQMSETLMRDENVFGVNMKAVIIYDDFTCATQVKAMFERAAQRANEAVQWIITPWRLDMLGLPGSAEAALAEAVDAHLLLFGLQNPLVLPPWLRNWLEQWAEHRQVQAAALAVWDGENGEVLPSYATPALSEFAARHGLSFIFRGAETVDDGIPVSTSNWDEGVWPLVRMEWQAQCPTFDYGFGINE